MLRARPLASQGSCGRSRMMKRLLISWGHHLSTNVLIRMTLPGDLKACIQWTCMSFTIVWRTRTPRMLIQKLSRRKSGSRGILPLWKWIMSRFQGFRTLSLLTVWQLGTHHKTHLCQGIFNWRRKSCWLVRSRQGRSLCLILQTYLSSSSRTINSNSHLSRWDASYSLQIVVFQVPRKDWSSPWCGSTCSTIAKEKCNTWVVLQA